jgi:hypothetical protein
VAEDRALVRNASDRKQVDNARKREKLRRDGELADLRSVLATIEGRRLVWRLLGKFKWGQTTFDENPAQMAFNVGMQNAGNYLMSEIVEADQSKLLLMMQESAAREKTDYAVADAVQQQAAGGRALTMDDNDGGETDAP